MISSLIDDISGRLSEVLELGDQQRQIIAYGLTVLLNNTFGFLGVIAIAYFLGAFMPTLLICITLLLLRPAAGGAHCSNPLCCNLFGFIFIPLIGAGVVYLANCAPAVTYFYIFVATIIALYGISLNAPYFTQEKPRAESRRSFLKTYALMATVLLFAFALILIAYKSVLFGLAISTGLLFQGIMLLPPGIKGTMFLDNLINRKVLRKGG